MLQKDYIIRIIEELSKILTKILFLKSSGKVEEALKEIENYSSDTLGIKLSLLEALPQSNIFDLLGNNQNGSIKCLLVAKLFKEKATIISSTNPERVQLYHKSLLLYLKTLLCFNINDDSVLSQYFDDIFYIEKEIRPYLTEEEIYLLFKFYDKIKHYEKAEDYLFFLKERNFSSIFEEGKKFFQKLKEEEESILNRCGLTKAEVKEAYEEFIKN